MIRLEIIANNTIELDLLELIESIEERSSYSKIGSVHGKGHSSPKQGDSVWPEENFITIIYCSKETGREYIAGIKEIKKRFPKEGIKVFSVSCVEID